MKNRKAFLSQQTQRRLFDVEKSSSRVVWKTPYFRPALKDFSGLQNVPLVVLKPVLLRRKYDQKDTFKLSLKHLLQRLSYITY